MFVLQAHILEYGLAVHEKFVPQDMRPLHKKLVDQFHLMKSSLGIQVRPKVEKQWPFIFHLREFTFEYQWGIQKQVKQKLFSLMMINYVLVRSKQIPFVFIIFLKSLSLLLKCKLHLTTESHRCVHTSEWMTPPVVRGESHPSLNTLPSSAFVCMFIYIPHAGMKKHLIMCTPSSQI